jgi:Ca-activated chloride channel family protein
VRGVRGVRGVREVRGVRGVREVRGVRRVRGVRLASSAAVVVGCLAVGVSAQQAKTPTFRAAVDLVNFGVMVVDKQGKPVTGLTVDDFEIIENGKRQAVTHFLAGTPEDAPPLHLGLLLDTSGSMASDLKDARTAAIKFVNALDRAADFTLVDFDTQVRVARFSAADYPRLVERIRERKADGWTALYDAVGVYLDGAQRQDGQKVLVIYTDGGDTTSALTFHDMFDLVKASDVTLYAVGYIERQGSGRLQQRADLERLAVATGGLAYFPATPKDIEGIFDKIREEIAARYSLGYVSTNTRADGQWRDVDIKLLRRDLKGVKLRTRSGYFAPYKPVS